jgi:hypothetical protein
VIEAVGEAAPSCEPGRLQILRANTLWTYRTAFASSRVTESPGRVVCWRGHGNGTARPRGLFAATVDVLTEVGAGLWQRTTEEHRERHHPRALVERALVRAGFDLVAVLGDDDFEAHLVYLARRRAG